jgi:hypothetical protein
MKGQVMKIKPVQFILVFLFVLSVCEFSSADGFYVPEVRQKLPDIPIQRALIKYRDGTETLMIESTLDGSGKYPEAYQEQFSEWNSGKYTKKLEP